MKWSAKELHIFNILQRYKHQARCFVVHALPEINARRPMVYIEWLYIFYEGVMLRLTMQVLFLKKIEKKNQKKNLERGFQLKAMDFQFS